MPSFDPQNLMIVLVVIFFAIGLHEYAHCKVADMAGDPTPGIYGRVTLNLTKHFEPLGTFMIIITSLSGFGIGWGKPAPMDPRKMGNPRWDFFAAVLAGPLCNVVQALIYGLILRVALREYGEDTNKLLFSLCLQGLTTNVALAVFNLIPLGPLDGHWLLGLLLPEKPRHYWYRFNKGFGLIALMVLVLGSQVMEKAHMPDLMGSIIVPVVNRAIEFTTGLRA